MTLTASDVSSLARSLSRWEYAEYSACALVALGCAGEYIADFSDWLTCGEELRKRRLAKRSTLLLISALALELLCLVQTNNISGQLIGSLSEQATNAAEKSELAVMKSGKAADTATSAESAAKDASKKSEDAVKSASNALSLAYAARREADSFERKIAKAEQDASAAEAHLAEAMQGAREATAELRRLKTPRSLANVDALVKNLEQFKGTEYRLSVFQDDESIQFTKMLEGALHRAGWIRKPSPYRLGITSIQVFGNVREDAIPICIETGVQMHFRSEESLQVLNTRAYSAQPRALQAAYLLAVDLRTTIDPPNEGNVGDKVALDSHSDDKFPFVICVGKKP